MRRNFFIVFIVLFFCMGFHPLHISVTSIEYESNKESIIISMKFFRDDFKAVIEQNYSIEINSQDCIMNKNDSISIKNYIIGHFSMKFDEDIIPDDFKIEEIKCNKESIWIISVIDNIKEFNKLEIKNTLLLDLYTDQKNLLIIKKNKIEKGYEFNNRITTININM